MKKAIVVTALLMTFATWAIAGQDPSQTTDKKSSVQSTVTGCLSRTDNGDYVLTDKSGTRYAVMGDAAKLNDHIGHEVQITGAVATPNAAPSNASATPSEMQTQIDVSRVKHIAESCSTKTKAEKRSRSMSEKPHSEKPMSEKPPIPPL
jgi:hypothetical protein